MVGIVRKKTRKPTKKVAYTGLSAAPQRQQPRGAYKAPTPSSRESQKTGGQQPQQQQQGGLLGEAIVGQQAVTGLGDMYKGGQDLREGFGGLENVYDKTTEYLGNAWRGSPIGEATSGINLPSFDMPSFDMPDMSSIGLSMPEFGMSDALSSGGSSAALGSMPSDFSSVNGSITSLGGDAVGNAAGSVYGGGEMSGLMEGSEGVSSALGDGATTGLKTPGIGEALPYLNIGVDLISGSDNLTGNAAGDAALRTTAAYATGGLSELGYAVGNMFDWW